jgi:hypothetical protein
MRGAPVGWMVVLACLGAGCGHKMQPLATLQHEKAVVANKETGTGAPKQPKPEAKKNEPLRVQVPLGEGDADWGHLPFKIMKVYKKQDFVKASPFHVDGGNWTFFDCRTASGTWATFTIGVGPDF